VKILNLYAGVGGNRKLWADCEVTSVEYTPKIADIYKSLYPNDELVIGDAHAYLLENFHRFDVIWSSPPCQSHSKMVKATRHKKARYADCSLYEEILLLQQFFEGSWIVENVVPYYTPLIEPTQRIGRHLVWSNKPLEGVTDVPRPPGFINRTNTAGKEALQDWLGIHYEGNVYYDGNHCPAQILRNCVHPELGKQLLDRLINQSLYRPV
jgi:DNA (cytosine-5)-methyltransferase 1